MNIEGVRAISIVLTGLQVHHRAHVIFSIVEMHISKISLPSNFSWHHVKSINIAKRVSCQPTRLFPLELQVTLHIIKDRCCGPRRWAACISITFQISSRFQFTSKLDTGTHEPTAKKLVVPKSPELYPRMLAECDDLYVIAGLIDFNDFWPYINPYPYAYWECFTCASHVSPTVSRIRLRIIKHSSADAISVLHRFVRARSDDLPAPTSFDLYSFTVDRLPLYSP